MWWKSAVAKSCVTVKSPFQTARPNTEIEIDSAPNKQVQVIWHQHVLTDADVVISDTSSKIVPPRTAATTGITT
jgi:hypothetical protein